MTLLTSIGKQYKPHDETNTHSDQKTCPDPPAIFSIMKSAWVSNTLKRGCLSDIMADTTPKPAGFWLWIRCGGCIRL